MTERRPADESLPETLDATRVAEVMSAPLVTCAADVPLWEVARLMTRHRIHCVVVLPDPGPAGEVWGVISELDLVGAAPFDDEEMTAGRVAGSPAIVVALDESLARAALLMSEYATTHLIAVGEDGEPVGIISALDIARVVTRTSAEPPGDEAPDAERRGAQVAGAHAGDRLIVQPHYLGEPPRDAEILEAHGPDGGPPFLVRWQEDGRVSLFYPGSDARVERLVKE